MNHSNPSIEIYSSPEEIRRIKNLKKGINFTLLICGQEGTGKSSFINSLCKQQVLQRDTIHVDPKKSHLNPGIEIIRQYINIIEEKSTPISLDIVFTPGFGDNIDNSKCNSKIIEYLENQFDEVLTEECRIQRDPRFKDGRPHAALYFIRPTSKGLRELDVETMKLLSTRVNIIPVIGKADSLTLEELKLNKALILQDIRANNIQIYDFPIDNNDSNEEYNNLKDSLPFAIGGSYEVEQIDNIEYHVRKYPWGVFKIEDLKHCDFTLLRNSIFGSHLQELKDSTHNILYENYRREKLIEHENYSKLKLNGGEEASLFEHYNYKDKSDNNNEIIETDETLREILRKKKVIENYTSEIKQLEKRLRVSSLSNKQLSSTISNA